MRLRRELDADPFMHRCIHAYLRTEGNPCSGRVEWEHAHLYAGRQINERWAIVPVCTYHHRGRGLDKNVNKYASLLRMTEEERTTAETKYPRTNWQQLMDWLGLRYPLFRLPDWATAK
jgi:hypothetical protein